MLETPKIVQTQRQHAAVLPLVVPKSEIRQVMGPGLNEVMAAVAAQKQQPAGAWFTHHHRMDPKVFDFEIGVPVNAPIKPQGRVKPGELSAARVARAIYQGPYEGLGTAWGEFEAWIAAQGHKAAPDLWEVYVSGPETGPDASKYRTELTRPLAG